MYNFWSLFWALETSLTNLVLISQIFFGGGGCWHPKLWPMHMSGGIACLGNKDHWGPRWPRAAILLSLLPHLFTSYKSIELWCLLWDDVLKKDGSDYPIREAHSFPSKTTTVLSPRALDWPWQYSVMDSFQATVVWKNKTPWKVSVNPKNTSPNNQQEVV